MITQEDKILRKSKWFNILSSLGIDEHAEFPYSTEHEAKRIIDNIYKAKSRYVKLHEPRTIFAITRLYTSKLITLRRDK